jgi:hypothetical protein
MQKYKGGIMKKIFNWLLSNYKGEKPTLWGWILNGVLLFLIIAIILSIIGGNIAQGGI